MTEKARDKRKHIRSGLMKESLVDKNIIKSTFIAEEFKVLPYVNIIKIGGQSIIDRGKEAVLPLVDEIVKNKKRHKMIIGVGGGVRERHTYSIGLDLGLPTGGLAMVAGAIPEQNALMLQVLLAKHGAIRIPKEHFEEFPLYLEAGIIPIIIAFPPYQYWEYPPKEGRIPPHGSDTGIYLLSECLGSKSMIYIKDIDGLYNDNPRKNKKAKFIKRISARKLIEMDLQELPIERKVLEIMLDARHTKKIQIINGLKTGNLTRALRGEEVGSIIYQE